MRRALWRGLALVMCLRAVALAEEPDGAVAEPARWTGPRGTPSGSYRSNATAVLHDVQEAWRIPTAEFDFIEGPPVIWDGRGYLTILGPRGRLLIAFDVRTGRVLASRVIQARRDVHKVGVSLHVWNDLVFVERPEPLLATFRFGESGFRPAWTYEELGKPYSFAMCEGDLYAPLADASVGRLRPRDKAVRWRRTGLQSLGRAAVHGSRVFVLAASTARDVVLNVYRRRDGTRVTSKKLHTFPGGLPGRNLSGTVSATHDLVCIGLPWSSPGPRGTSYVFLPYHVDGETLQFGEPRGYVLAVPPAHHRTGTLMLASEPEDKERKLPARRTWYLWIEAGKGKRLASDHQQPELFRSVVPPTIAGDVAYFGAFAADLVTFDILWRLPVKDVSYAAVPADGLVLVVESRKVLRAFRDGSIE